MNYLSYILDAFPIIVLALCIFNGRQKGFTKIILSLVATVICMIIAKEYANELAVGFTNQFIHERLVKGISEKIMLSIERGSGSLSNALPDLLVSCACALKLPVDHTLSGLPVSQINSISEQIAVYAEDILIVPLLTCICFIFSYLFAKLIAKIFIKLTDLITKLPLIKQVNRALGAFAGAIMGVFAAGITVLIIVTAASFFPDTPFSAGAEKAELLQLFYSKILLLI